MVVLQYDYSMTATKFSISVTPELARALEQLAKERRDDRSRLIEMLLRENALIAAKVADLRGPANPGTKNGRDIEKLLAIGRLARRQWEMQVKAGKVGIVG